MDYDMAVVGQRIIDAQAALEAAAKAFDEAADKVKAVPEEACPVCGHEMEDARTIMLATGSVLSGKPADLFRYIPLIWRPCGRGQRCRHGYQLTVCKQCRNAFLTALEHWADGEFS